MRNRLCALLLLAALLAACAPSGPATFTSADGAITFRYPAGWVVQEANGQILFGTNQTALASTGTTATLPGQFAGAITVFSLTTMGRDFQPGAAPLEVVGRFGELLTEASATAGDTNVPAFGAPTELTIGERSAARVAGTSGPNEALLIAVSLGDDWYALAAGGAAAGELTRFEPELLAILSSLDYKKP